MGKRSLSLTEKLNARFVPDQDVTEAVDLLTKAKSGLSFNSANDLADNLVEGSLLNVSVIASRALSVPQGEYMVWMTDNGHTMLIPTADKRGNGEVYEHSTDGYEVQTRDLLANWNRIERTIAENGPFEQATPAENPNEENLEEPEGEPGDEASGKAGEFRSTIDASTVDRTPLMRAMQDRGYTVTSLAKEVGVDPPAISRILRTPKDVQGDPGGRNPSMGLASQICTVLRLNPTAAFPDIFAQNERYQPRQQSGNDGSGSPSQGNNSGGSNLPESYDLSQSIAILEATENYQTLCEDIAYSDVSFDQFWQHVFIPTLLRTTPRTDVAVFSESLINEFGRFGNWLKNKMGRGSKPTSASNGPIDLGPYADNDDSSVFEIPNGVPQGGNPQTLNGSQMGSIGGAGNAGPRVSGPNGFNPNQNKMATAQNAMNAKLLPNLQQAFEKSMATFKQNLQQTQLGAGVDPKTAPHVWKMAEMFYNDVVKAAKTWKPKWKAQPKGTGNSYDDAYNQASADFKFSQQAAQNRANGSPSGRPPAPAAPAYEEPEVEEEWPPQQPVGTNNPLAVPGGNRGLANTGNRGMSTVGGGGLAQNGGRAVEPYQDYIDAEYEVKPQVGNAQRSISGGQTAIGGGQPAIGAGRPALPGRASNLPARR